MEISEQEEPAGREICPSSHVDALTETAWVSIWNDFWFSKLAA